MSASHKEEGVPARPLAPAPVKPVIPFSSLEAVDVRVGTIRRVDDVAGSRKLAVPERPVPDGARAG